MRVKSALAILYLCLALSCIEQLPLPTGSTQPRLLVDGMITQEAGPHSVKLFMTGTSLTDAYTPVSGATLIISNNLLQQVNLTEVEPGLYQTPNNWMAQQGKLYQLKIMLADGREYISEDQHLYSAGTIDELHTELKLNSINQDNISLPQHAIHVSVDGHGDDGQDNLFRWRWKGTYEVFTNPELFEVVRGGALIVEPLPCSGLHPGGPYGPCTCCSCWVTDKDFTARVSRSFTENGFLRQPITIIPVDQFRFFIRYHVEVEQLSLSPQVYDFWKRLESQQQGAQNIFQPNAIKIKGNITSVTNPKEEVLGIFAVSAVVRQTRFIDQFDLGGIVSTPPVVKNDCRIPFANSSNVKPDFW